MNPIRIKKDNSVLSTLFIVFSIIYVLSSVSNIFSGLIPRIIQVFMMLVLFLIALFIQSDNQPISKIVKGVFLFAVYVSFYRVVRYSTAGWGVMLMQISFFSAIIAAIYCLSRIKEKKNIVFYYAIIIIMLYVLLRDVFLNRTYNYYMLATKASFNELEELGSYVGWTAFSTMVLFLYSTCLLVILNKPRNNATKIFHFVVLFLSAYYLIFCSMRGTVVILLLLVTILLLYVSFSKKNTFFKIISIALMIVLVVALIVSPSIILNFLADISPNERLANRMYDIQRTYNEGISDDSFSGRFGLEILSLRTWLQNPLTFLFGIGDHRVSDFGIQGFFMTGIGGHSEIIDSLARFGVVGFSIMATLFYRMSSFLVSLFDNPNVKKQVRIIIVIFILAALTKAVLFHIIGIVFFILFPLSSLIINKQNKLI